MQRRAWIYIYSALVIAGLLTLAAYAMRSEEPVQIIWTFLGLSLLSTLLMVFVVFTPSHRAYEGSTIGWVAGIFLLPPWLFAFQVIIAHLAQWAWVRHSDPQSSSLRAWYIQPFNIAKGIISGFVAYAVIALLPGSPPGASSIVDVLAVLIIVVAFVATNQVMLGLALYLARGIPFREAGIWRDATLIEIPLACIGFVVFILTKQGPLATIYVLAPIALVYQAFMLPKVQDEAVKALESVNRDLTKANQAIRQLNDELFSTLAKVFDARDPYVGGHAAQVAAYAVAIAKELQLPAERVQIIQQCGYLHDIGKIAIPESILHKPGPLTKTEYEFAKKHADIGADFVSTSHGLQHLAPFIRHHHERWDGQGYPLGLAGQVIPLEARILNVCDAVEAMASDRPYHRALSVGQIIGELERHAGHQFDPGVVDAFKRIVQREGDGFVVNSARTVAVAYAHSMWGAEGPGVELLNQLYGSHSTRACTSPEDPF